MVPHYFVQKSESLAARRTVYIPIRSSTGYVTPATVGTDTAKISTDGGSAAASTSSLAAVTGTAGWAKLVLDLTEIASLGRLVIEANGSGYFGQCVVDVVRWDPFSEGSASRGAQLLRAGRK